MARSRTFWRDGVDALLAPFFVLCARRAVIRGILNAEGGRGSGSGSREPANMSERPPRIPSSSSSTARMDALARATRALTEAAADFDSGAQRVVEHIAGAIGDSCVLCLVSDDGLTLRPIAYHSVTPAVDCEMAAAVGERPLDSGSPAARVATTGATFLSNGSLADLSTQPEVQEYIRETGTHAVAIVPISRGGRVVGTLGLSRDVTPEGFSTEDVSLLQALADAAGIALQNARLLSERTKLLDERSSVLEREREARIAAEHAIRIKDEFLRTVSHELRTPLNAILGWSQVAGIENLDRDVTSRAIEAIQRNARLQTRLVTELLDMSRIESGKLRLNAVPVDLAEVIREVLQTSRPAAEAKRLKLESQVEDGELFVLGDRHRLSQVTWNLLSNAIKFTPRQGSVQVRLHRSGSNVELIISDSGAGIPEDYLPALFDRFRQVDGSPSRLHSGLGLGLAITRELIELQGGSIEAASGGPGQGARFTVRLPAAAAINAIRSPPVVLERVKGRALAGVQILLVADDVDVLEPTRFALERSGATVAVAGSMRAALDAIGAHVPHVLVSDIGLPDGSGYDLVRVLRTLAPGQGGRIPAVALTADDGPEGRMMALEAGFQTHVPKPVYLAELVVVIARLLGIEEWTESTAKLQPPSSWELLPPAETE